MKKTPTTSTSDPLVCPFIIVIDSAEQSPFEFRGIRSDANTNRRPYIVEPRWQCLGRHPKQLGDYSIDGCIGECHVERKSVADCQGTILGWGGSRDRFEQELANLSHIRASLVVVEGSLQAVLRTENQHRVTPHRVIAKQLLRSIIAFQQDYRVPWLFCETRRMAEIATFRFLERYWRKQQEHARRINRMLANL